MAYLFLTLSTLFWSGNFVLSRAMHADIPPVSLAFWRWALAFLILLPFSVHHCWRQRDLLRKHVLFLLVQGVLGVTGFNTLIYLAMQSTTAINAVLVNSCIPVIIAVVSWLMYRERLTIRQSVGVLISLAGVLLIIAHGDIFYLLNLRLNRGDLLVFVAAVVWAVYSANLKRYPAGLHPLAYLSGIIFLGIGLLLPIFLFEMQTGKILQINAGSLLTIAYVALFASVLAFICWNRAVREVGANRAGPFIHLMPVFSTILAVVFLDEFLTGYHVQGIALVFSGIVLTTVRSRKKKEC